MLILLAALAGASADADARFSRMTALYDEVCLRAFPEDRAVEAVMAARHTRPLTADQVKVTMGDDPARAWWVEGDGNATVWLELPPFHACSVRWNAPALSDMSEYQAIAARYEAKSGGFRPINPMNSDHGPIHIHAVGEQLRSPDGSAESLFVIDQQITDPARRAAGETGYSIRFVHQIAPPPAAAAK